MGGNYVSLKLEKPFNEHDSVLVICDQPVKRVVDVLSKLQVGDELYCTVTGETGEKARFSSSRTFHLKSLARLDDADSVLLGKAEVRPELSK